MKGTSPREMHAQDRRENINFIYNPIFEPPFQNIVNDDLLLGGPSGFEGLDLKPLGMEGSCTRNQSWLERGRDPNVDARTHLIMGTKERTCEIDMGNVNEKGSTHNRYSNSTYCNKSVMQEICHGMGASRAFWRPKCKCRGFT